MNGWPVLDTAGNRSGNVRCVAGTGGLGASGCDNTTGAVVEVDSTGRKSWCAVNTSRLSSPLVDDVTTSVALEYLKEVPTVGLGLWL